MKRTVLRLLGRSRLQCVVNFLMIRFLRQGFLCTILKRLSRQPHERCCHSHWVNAKIVNMFVFAAWSREKHWRKRAIFILWMREHIHIHSSPPPHLCGFFFLPSEQISIFQPQIIPNIYVQSQAFKHSCSHGRQILTPTSNLDCFFPSPLPLTHSTIKVFKGCGQGWKKKK